MSDTEQPVFGEFRREPTRAWKKGADDSPMVCYLGMKGRVTVADLVQHFAEEYPHVDPMCLRLNFATVTWEEPPTPADIAHRAEVRARHAERTEQWERDTLVRLKAKYESSPVEEQENYG
jgi:hypothetical protein